MGATVSARLRNLFAAVAIVGLAAVLAVVSPSAAAVLAYDPFLLPDSDGDPLTNPAEAGLGEYNFYDYPEENLTPPPYPDDPAFVYLRGQNPTIGPSPGSGPSFWAGPWISQTPYPSSWGGSIVQQSGLSYIGAPALGGSATTWPRPDPAFDETMEQSEGNTRYLGYDGSVGREFATPWNDDTPDGTTYYMSFLANFGTTEGGMGYRTVQFWRTGVDLASSNPDPFRVMEIGYNEYSGYNGATNPGSLQTNPATARLAIRTDFPDNGVEVTLIEGETAAANFNEDTSTHLIVFKLELNAAAESDTVTVYLDPPSIVEPDLPGALHVAKDIDIAAMSTISRFGGPDTRQAFPVDDPNYRPFSNTAFDELRIGTTFQDVMPDLPYPGDTDDDDDADLDDLATIKSFWGQTVGGGPSQGDVAGASGRQGSDGFVGLADFALWKSWRTDAGSGAGSAGGIAPEPSSWILALIAMLGLAGYSRRSA